MATENPPTIVIVFGVLKSMIGLAWPSALVAALSIVLRWIYHRAVWRPSRKLRHPAPAEPRHDESGDAGVKAADVPVSTRPERVDAATTTRDIQLAHAVAGLVYASIVVGVLLAHARFGLLENSVVVAYASLVPSLLIVTWSMRLGLRRTMWVFLTYAALGVFLTSCVVMRNPFHSVRWAAVFALLSICPLLPLLVRSIQPFVFLLLPLVILVFGVGMMVDRTHPEIINNAVTTLVAAPWLVVLGLANIVAGFFLARLVLRQRWPVRVIAFAVALAGAAVLNQTAGGRVPPPVAISAAVAAAVLQMLICGALFALFAWLQGQRVLTSELLHIHFVWTAVTVYFEVLAFLQPTFAATRWSFVLALVFSTITLHVLLFFIRRRRPPDAEKRVLLLRKFGGPDERQDLLDGLSDTWRRVGAVDIIAGIDVAMGAMQPGMLRAFLLRLTSQQFFRDEEDVAKRLGELPSKIGGDVRYPVNPVYCAEPAWKSAFKRLDKKADAVLMDVRGFTMDNEGVVWELTTLFDDVELQRIVLLADSSTNRQALETVLAGRNVARLHFGSPSHEERRALFDLLLNAAYGSSA